MHRWDLLHLSASTSAGCGSTARLELRFKGTEAHLSNVVFCNKYSGFVLEFREQPRAIISELFRCRRYPIELNLTRAIHPVIESGKKSYCKIYELFSAGGAIVLFPGIIEQLFHWRKKKKKRREGKGRLQIEINGVHAG